jgi:Family of unknown function (DUF6011)
MRCGHCKGDHDTVAQVRDCSARTAVTTSGGIVRPCRTVAVHRPPVTEDGIYVLDGQVYKVVSALHGSGRLYAKVLMPADVKGARAKWQYAKGAVYRLSSVDRMTPEQASEFGKLYGVCCSCGLPLTDERSIEHGYGPTCAENHGWPY